MAIPDFQMMMRPILSILADGKEHPIGDIYGAIGDFFQLSKEERVQLLPSGKQFIVSNRVGWALTHFKAAKVAESSKRGVYKITQRGRDVLQKNAQQVDLSVLDQFEEHVAFRTPKTSKSSSTAAPVEVQATPEEAILQAYQELRASLAQELLEKIKQSSPQFFERLVVDVLLGMGYGGSERDAGEALGRSGDGGIDGVIREDKLGLDVIYIQAKRWEGVVGRPVVQGFVGAIHGARASKGVIITTSDFTTEAKEYVKTIPTRIVLVDGRTLAELMIDHNVAVGRVSNFEIKKVDNDYFSEL